ncbi:hypothetical protein AUP68_08348 [Ilyonectria robusta]
MVSIKMLLVFLALGADVLVKDTYRPVVCSTKLGTKFVKYPSTKTSTKTVYATQTEKIYKRNDVTITPRAITTTGPGYVAKRSLPCERAASANPPKGNTLLCKKGSDPIFGVRQYAQSVDCTRTLVRIVKKTVTVYVKPCTTTLKAQTVTATTTLTETATITEYPADVSTTVTETTSTTVTETTENTETTTVTATSTIETVVPAATPYYAACGADNIISTANGGKPITLVQAATGGSFNSIGSSQTAYSCCVLCQNTTNCLASILSGTTCFGLIRTTCAVGQLASDNYRTGTGTAFTMSNGACGIIANAVPTEQAEASKLWSAADLKIPTTEDMEGIRTYTFRAHCFNEHGASLANTEAHASRSRIINGEIVYLSQSSRPTQTDGGGNLTIVLPATNVTVPTVAINGAGSLETLLQPAERAFEKLSAFTQNGTLQNAHGKDGLNPREKRSPAVRTPEKALKAISGLIEWVGAELEDTGGN